MSASTDRSTAANNSGRQTDDDTAAGPPRHRILAGAWRPASLLYLAALLAALAIGLWPEAIFPSRADVRAAPLPTLQVLAVVQVSYFLLAYPLIVLVRSARRTVRPHLAPALAEVVTQLLMALPFYVAAGYLADATLADCLRTAAYVSCVCLAALFAGSYLAADGGPKAPALLILIIAVVGLPAAYYLALEFLAALGQPGWLWHLGPATFAWEIAASRPPTQPGTPIWGPGPLWAWLVWPAVAAAGVCIRAILHGRHQSSSRSDVAG